MFFSKIRKKKILFWFLIILYSFFPYVISYPYTIDEENLNKEVSISLGTLKTKTSYEVEFKAVLGDVFQPKDKSNELSYDLVAVSCYFDPLYNEGEELLPLSPVLTSALASSSNAEELELLSSYIYQALHSNRDIFECYATNFAVLDKCEGDEFVPFVCTTNGHKSIYHQEIRWMALMPLFNPNIFRRDVNPQKVRERLARNIVKVTRRLVSEEFEKQTPRIRSAAFAALGSTSHRGGDSNYFLNFDDGFLSIIKGIEKGSTRSSFDIVYLVGFDKLGGQFKEDMLGGLGTAGQYIFVNNYFNGENSAAKIFFVSIFMTGLILLVYQNGPVIWRDRNRFAYVSLIYGVACIFAALSYSSAVLWLESTNFYNFKSVFIFHGAMSTLVAILILILSKRLKFKTSQ